MTKNVQIMLGDHPRFGFQREAILKSFIVNLDSEVAIFYYDLNVYDENGDIIPEMSSKENALYFEKGVGFLVLDEEGNPVTNPDKDPLDLESPEYLEEDAFETIYKSLESYLIIAEGIFLHSERNGHLK